MSPHFLDRPNLNHPFQNFEWDFFKLKNLKLEYCVSYCKSETQYAPCNYWIDLL